MTQHSALSTQHSALSYEDALAFWLGRINYEVVSPKPGDLKLDQMHALLHRLGNPHQRLRIIHVAGSKGKGSTSAMLASVLQHAGYRTGLFTSPHLHRIEERIQVDGVPITPEELTTLITGIRDQGSGIRTQHSALSTRHPPPATRHPPPATFFEIAAALGFLHFVQRRVDVAVVEVGLGGRFDATNVCRPLVSVITSISFDHTRQLGNTLASIALEKAGIVKPGRPTISGVTPAEPREVIEAICRERGSLLLQLGRDFHYVSEAGQVTAETERRPRVRVTTRRRFWPSMELGLLGEHQAVNAAVVLACVEELREQGLHVSDAAATSGLAEVRWPARLEVVQRRPLVVLDCAHNVASAHVLIDALRTSFPPTRRLLIFAGSNDKDLAGMLRVLTPHFAHVFLTRYGSSPRSMEPEKLAELLDPSEVSFSVHSTAKGAWEAARAQARQEELICITGSVFLAGEMREIVAGCP